MSVKDEADDMVSGKLIERWKPFTEVENKEFEKILQKHKEEVEKRTGMSFKDWMVEVCKKLGI